MKQTTTEKGNEMTITPADFSAKGNAVAFTTDGETISISKKQIPHISEWKVEVTLDGKTTLSNNPRSRSFASKQQAAAYASEIADADKTEELAWW